MDAGNQSITFISYSRRDSEFALELVNELRAAGFAIWFDQLDIQPGSRWDDEIEKALTQCSIFMVLLTPSSTASNNVKDEISYAIDKNKLIMPVLLKNAVVPLRLRRFQYVDFTEKSYEEGIEAAKQLLNDLLLEGPSRVTVQPVEQNYTAQIHTNARKEPESGPKNGPSTRVPFNYRGHIAVIHMYSFHSWKPSKDPSPRRIRQSCKHSNRCGRYLFNSNRTIYKISSTE